MNLPRWSLRNPVTATTTIVSILALGAISVPRLPQAFLPEVSFPSLEIQIPYPNALPAQVEEEITRPAEEALATLSRVRKINSESSANGANINVQFDWGQDILRARQIVTEKLTLVSSTLPPEVEQPFLAPVSSIMGEIMFVALESEKHSPHGRSGK